MQQYNVIGLMSGSSLDGVDLCYAEFYMENEQWRYRNCIAETIAYDEEWNIKLKNAGIETGAGLFHLHAHYGHYLGNLVNTFIAKNKLHVDLVSSHGHTVFHQPQNKFTTQIGDGAAIYAVTGIKSVSDLRTVDIALGGQGAPLVPVGERDLFDSYGMFLNLGGIANISVFTKENKVLAHDISPCNMPLNILCEKYFNTVYDKNGELSSKGKLDKTLLHELEHLGYFKLASPKSLGREFIIEEYLPVVEHHHISPEDKLYTISYHIADEISKAINGNLADCRQQTVLATGGGVYNKFLMDMLSEKTDIEITIPEPMIIEFKEALIFAYLGLLRITGRTNALSSVTNATKDSIGGALWG